MVAWILTLMLALQPSAPWAYSYRDTAVAIDRAAHAAPLFDGDVPRTVTEIVAVAWYESKFDPHAEAYDGSGALCLGQIDPSNLDRFFLTREALLGDVDLCVHTMLRIIAESHRVCAHRSRLERLGQYTGGGADCTRGLLESRRRARLAEYLMKAHPPKWVEHHG